MDHREKKIHPSASSTPAPILLNKLYREMRKTEWGMFTKKRPLRVGTDCSGMEAPIVALTNLGVPFTHEFSSEVDKHCIATIKANFHPKIIFEDMTKRHLKDIPDMDLYVCGFPCQPFSIAGKRDGTRDPRGTVFWECLRVIQHKRPMMFVLENVQGLLSMDNGHVFQAMLNALSQLKGYHVDWRVLNTADYGIPQSRKRLFIVGKTCRAKQRGGPFHWPSPTTCIPLQHFIDFRDTSRDTWTDRTLANVKRLQRCTNDLIFVDRALFFPDRRIAETQVHAPCLNTVGGLLNVPLHRKANKKEHMWLQGFLEENLPRPHTSASLHKKMMGNAMSVNVIAVVLNMLLECCP